jgi:hypothetical protein
VRSEEVGKKGTMELRYPTGYDIKAEEIGDGNWRLSYTEKFAPGDLEAVKNSMEILNSVLPDEASLQLSGDTVVIELNASRDRVMDYLAGEFLAVSSLGKTTLNQLLAEVTTAYGARQQERRERCL